MIKSMTGFGKSHIETDTLSVSVEVKTLNSKYLDTTVRISHLFSSKEIDVKNMVQKSLERGKVLVNINYTSKRTDLGRSVINRPLLAAYYHELKAAAQELGVAESPELFSYALQLPDVMAKPTTDDLLEQDWQIIAGAIQNALNACNTFRSEEGQELLQKFDAYIHSIGRKLEDVEADDPKRLQKLRERLQIQIKDFAEKDNFDSGRFEQELIFYIEKLDISEEKVRLKNHLNYFLQTLHAEQSSGKKLGFIAQEIGREINTIGSKANSATIQQQVVGMKEELEKIKEQALNIL